MPVDHTTIYRWVQKYAPELDKQTRWYRQVPDWQASSWRVDGTYIRVGGRWCYLYRAITAGGQTLDFYLSPKQNVAAAKRFLAKAVRSRQDNKQDDLLTPSKTKARKPRAGVRM